MKVVLKPTNFKEDEILFRATSPGGTSLASDKDYIPASTATQVIAAGGLGKFSVVDLRRVLTGKIAGATPFIGELDEGLNGSSSRKDLETLFQLIYMRFTQPRADATAFAVQQTQMKAADREPDGRPRVCVQRDAHDNALPEPRQATGPVASHNRRVESRRLGGLL